MPENRSAVNIFIIFLIFISISPVIKNQFAAASDNTIWVDDSYQYPHQSDGSSSKPFTTIQNAVNAAENGDIIMVREGTYKEEITVNKKITLRSEVPEKAIIVGCALSEYLIGIKSEEVSVQGFKLLDPYSTYLRQGMIYINSSSKDSSVLNNTIEQCAYSYAIFLDGVDDIVLRGNHLNNTTGGIFLQNSDYNTIISNRITNNSDEYALKILLSDHNLVESNIFQKGKYSIYIEDSGYNSLSKNLVVENSHRGGYIKSGKENTFEENIFHSNNIGLYLNSEYENFVFNNSFKDAIGIVFSGKNDIVSGNEFSDCNLYGILAESSTEDNTVYNNYFMGQSYVSYAKENGDNNWFNEKIEVGNYWEDFNGPNRDNQYVKENLETELFEYNKNGLIDKYPLGRFNNPPRISNEIPSHLSTNISLKPKLSVIVSDADQDKMTVYFYQIKNNTTLIIDEINRLENGSNVSVNLFPRNKYFAEGYNYICEWYVVVEDSYYSNRSENFLFTTSETPINNIVPVIQFESPDIALVDEEVVFNASSSFDPDGQIVFYRWILGDGTIKTNTNTFRHCFKNPGEYNCSLLVIDNNGSSKTTSFTVDIKPKDSKDFFSEKLSCSISTTNNIFNANQEIYLNSSAKGGFPPYTFLWNINEDDTLYYSNQNISLTFNETGSYLINLTTTDKFGNTASDTIIIDVILPDNDSIDNSEKEKIPGFELLLIILSIIIFSRFSAKKRK